MTAAAPQIQAPPPPAPPARAPRPRRVTQYIVIAVVLIFGLGHLWDIVAFQEHWPYSRYSMYSTKKPKKTQAFEVWGIRARGERNGSDEFKMQRSGEFIVPLASIKRMYGTGRPNEVKRVRAAMREFVRYYNDLRTKRHHPGPPIRGVRVYRTTFFLKDDAGNAKRPDVRELLIEAESGRAPRKARAATTTAPATRPAGTGHKPKRVTTLPSDTPRPTEDDEQ
jgi:hypothetical protein